MAKKTKRCFVQTEIAFDKEQSCAACELNPKPYSFCDDIVDKEHTTCPKFFKKMYF